MAKRHQPLAGVADAGHPRIGHNGAVFTVHQPPQKLRPAGGGVVLMVADEGIADLKMIEQLQGHAGVLRGDKIHRPQHLGRTGRKIPQIPDGRADNIQGSHTHTFLYKI